MTITYDSIATTTLGSATNTITFNSIPGSYTDLRVVISGSFSGNLQSSIRFNNLSTSIYSYTELVGNGTTATSGFASNDNRIYFTYNNVASTAQPFLITADVFNYTNSKNKTTLYTFNQDINGAGGQTVRGVGLWRDTSVITRIDLFAGANNFTTGTVATLYGIKAE
jgi:hypothetical protein